MLVFPLNHSGVAHLLAVEGIVPTVITSYAGARHRIRSSSHELRNPLFDADGKSRFDCLQKRAMRRKKSLAERSRGRTIELLEAMLLSYFLTTLYATAVPSSPLGYIHPAEIWR